MDFAYFTALSEALPVKRILKGKVWDVVSAGFGGCDHFWAAHL